MVQNGKFADTKTEKLRMQFRARAANAPIPDLFGDNSKWEQYVDEMRTLESQLRDSGVSL